MGILCMCARNESSFAAGVCAQTSAESIGWLRMVLQVALARASAVSVTKLARAAIDSAGGRY